uniref:Homeobox domain-containing protein n=1 Tax=Pelusios castaneus TaxID=367368 RepID=A0A8C8RUG4_9SAUR
MAPRLGVLEGAPASPPPRDKRLRTTILPEQLDVLYRWYVQDSNPTRKMLDCISEEVGLKKRVVQVWFQNTRARERKGQFRCTANAGVSPVKTSAVSSLAKLSPGSGTSNVSGSGMASISSGGMVNISGGGTVNVSGGGISNISVSEMVNISNDVMPNIASGGTANASGGGTANIADAGISNIFRGGSGCGPPGQLMLLRPPGAGAAAGAHLHLSLPGMRGAGEWAGGAGSPSPVQCPPP